MLCACCRGAAKGNPAADRVWPFARRESYPVGGRVLTLSVSLLVVAVRTRTGQISGCVCLRVGTEGPIDVCPPYADSERARRKFPPSSRCAHSFQGRVAADPPRRLKTGRVSTHAARERSDALVAQLRRHRLRPSVRTDRLSKHRVRAGLLAALVGTLTPSARE